jgi:hypothetical protein
MSRTFFNILKSFVMLNFDKSAVMTTLKDTLNAGDLFCKEALKRQGIAGGEKMSVVNEIGNLSRLRF